ncbi:rod shape-determining protein MreC [Polycladomyces subterraneus]|uniref:Cell shape-determining protein MreC n=1 Tax=Polycladomyces subterraneus TaxID=1016997 RepID=A0ABT8IMB8_9BACL|nr:rod shape-determining protein MreC [Polycladomyces subterraneus]MDN4593931.1 rod shape-determining protein MreC [Polycladomyces subterraneus]
MSRLFGNRRLLVLLLSMIALLSMMGMTRGERNELTLPERWIKNVTDTVGSGLYRPTSVLVRWFHAPSPSGETSASTQVLQLKSQLARLQEENRQLKEIIGYRKGNEVSYIAAHVVARNPDRWNNRVMIDRGSEDGVLVHMPVITNQGLIGRVIAVTGHMADVQLLTDSDESPGIAAHLQTAHGTYFGIVDGFDEERQRLVMKYIPATAKPKKGDIVVTSDQSDIYTGGLLIGTVDGVAPGEYGVDKTVYVKPAASMEQLSYVLVVRDPEKIQLRQFERQTGAAGNGGK